MSSKDHVAVRLDNETLGRVDVLKDVLTTPWHEATRSDILRAVILSGLEALEQEHKGSVGKAPGTRAPIADRRSRAHRTKKPRTPPT